ncbi:AI-2E family transporter [Erythrobacter sp. F6033]|uniref:AI-2E family transporter n=1 Tax=Erythrobacter sp. F6033 TaxID=2926401 RepID=UPI001FF1E942|nr:AI-2E family transporter [Erythrobacter sp. F6033]MCK0129524.1 AI-2E family transporter [Erythrobacter sp. F6033]
MADNELDKMTGEQHHTTEIQQVSFLAVVGAVTFLLIWIAWPFATPLLWSALAAIMFQPLYKWVLIKVRGRRNPAAIITLSVIFLAVVLPALWIGTMVVGQALSAIASFQNDPIDLAAWANHLYSTLPIPVQDMIDESGWNDMSEAQRRLQDLLGESSGMLASSAVSIGSGALSFFLSFGLGLYVTYFLLRDGSRIGETILHSAPVEREIADRLAERFLGIVRATIKGSGVVGLVQGTLGGITMAIAGVPSALLLAVMMAILALIPAVGTALVWAPVGIWLLVTGSVWQGVFVLASGFIIISSADNVLRPILVGRDTGIPDWIILVTTLGGLSIAGFSGIVLGPLVAGLFLASWSILQEQRAEDEEAAAKYRTRVGIDGKARDDLVAPVLAVNVKRAEED